MFFLISFREHPRCHFSSVFFFFFSLMKMSVGPSMDGADPAWHRMAWPGHPENAMGSPSFINSVTLEKALVSRIPSLPHSKF